MGIAAAVTGKLHPEILPLCLPMMVGIGLIMMTNNTCDIEKDIRAGRNTLPNCLGRERALNLYRGAVLLWMLLIIIYGAVLGIVTFIAAVVLVTAAYLPVYRYLIHSPLTQRTRVAQMKGILKANICSGVICIFLMVLAIILK